MVKITVPSKVMNFFGEVDSSSIPCVMETADDAPISTAYVCAPLVLAKHILRANGYDGIKLWENAQLYLQEPENEAILGEEVLTAQGVLYVPNENPRVIPIGPHWIYAAEATKAASQDASLKFKRERIQSLLEQGFEIRRSDLNEGLLVLNPRDLGSNEYGLKLFGGDGTDEIRSKRAQSFGDWLLNSKHKIDEDDGRVVMDLTPIYHLTSREDILVAAIQAQGITSNLRHYPLRAKAYYFQEGINAPPNVSRYNKIRGIKRPQMMGALSWI